MQKRANLLAAVVVSCSLIGCGAPGGSLSAPERANRSDAGAKIFAPDDAGTPEVPAVPPANDTVVEALVAVPEQSPVQLEALLLDGPHKNLQRFCALLRKDGRGRCARGKNDWAPHKIGPRHRIRAAETFRVRRGNGEGAHEICPLAIHAPDGWYVALDDVPCQAGDPEDPERETSLVQMRWADELAFGMLLVERHGEGWFDGSDDDDPVPVPSVSGNGTERRYCGLDRDGKPRCTRWLATSSSGGGCSGRVEVEHENELITTSHRGNNLDECKRSALPSGSYELTDAFGERAAIEQTNPDDQIADAEGPLAAHPLFGPFTSLDDYCRALPTPWDLEIPSEEDGYDNADAPDRCATGKGGWNRRPPLRARGPFLGAKLMRIKGEIAGAKVEYCRLAVRTDEGWYVSFETEQCAGVLGPSSTARVKTTDFAWRGPDASPVLGVGFQVDTGTSYKARDNLEKDDLSRSYWIRLCGFGPSGRPSCTRDIATGCEDPISGKFLPVLWTILEGKLIMSAPTRAQAGKKKHKELEEDDTRSCDSGCWAPDSFPNKRALEFP